MLEIVKDLIWGVAIILLLCSGITFTVIFKFIQLNLKKTILSFRGENGNNFSHISSLMMSLAAKIGVGSLAGVALSIYIGGPGTVFWMWLISLITSTNSFAESILGIKYRKKCKDMYYGGPTYYISEGLNNKWLAVCYAIILIFTFIIGFNTIQSNSISKMIMQKFNIQTIITGILLSILAASVILKNNTYISNFINKLVPIMAILYFFVGGYIIINNYILLPNIIKLIFNSALNIRAFGTSLIGTFIIGVQRGIFTSEAGMGTSAIASGMSDSNSIQKTGYIQMFGVNFTTFIICTCTAFIILMSDYSNFICNDINGIELTNYAFRYHLGDFGGILLLIILMLFAFSTIISGYYFSETNLRYFFPQICEKKILIFKLLTILLIFFGSIIKSSLLWYIADILIGLLCIINIYSIFRLKNEIKNIYYNSFD